MYVTKFHSCACVGMLECCLGPGRGGGGGGGPGAVWDSGESRLTAHSNTCALMTELQRDHKQQLWGDVGEGGVEGGGWV